MERIDKGIDSRINGSGVEHCEAFTVSIYLAGPIEVAKQLLRGYCAINGACFTITPTTYIYTFGEEIGYIVGLINYARFPSTPLTLLTRAKEVANMLMTETHQRSASIVTPLTSYYLKRELTDEKVR